MSKEHCCCGCIHVRTGALIIGYLILIFGIIGLLASVVTGNAQGIASNKASVIIGGFIVYADKSQKPGGYLPYLIFVAIGIVIYTVLIIFFVFMVFMALIEPGTLPNYTQDYGYGTQHKDREIDPKTAMLIGFLIVTPVVALVYWIAIWLWMVVYRAYQHMCIEENDREQTYQVKLNDV